MLAAAEDRVAVAMDRFKYRAPASVLGGFQPFAGRLKKI